MGYFDELIVHLNRKKPKKGDDGYFGKPIITESDKLLTVEYNHYYVTVLYDPNNTSLRPKYCPYKLSIEKPCVIRHFLATERYADWFATLDDVWVVLQNRWRRTIL